MIKMTNLCESTKDKKLDYNDDFFFDIFSKKLDNNLLENDVQILSKEKEKIYQ